MNCLFCAIIAGTIPSQKVYEDDRVLIFKDISPQAPVHLLAIPKKHITSIAEANKEEESLLGHLLLKASEAAKSEGLSKGYRLVTNIGDEGCQSVKHLHIHILGGRQLTNELG